MRWVRDLGIGPKIYLVIGFLSAVAGALGWVSLDTMQAYDQKVSAVGRSFNRLYYAEAARGLVIATTTGLRAAAASAESASARREAEMVGRTVWRLREALEVLEADADEASESLARHAYQRLDTLAGLARQAVERIGSENSLSAREWLETSNTQRVAAEMMSSLDQLVELNQRQLVAIHAEARDYYDSRAALLILLVVGGITIAVAMVTCVVVLVVTRPLHRIAAVIKRLTAGALDIEVADADRADEIGNIARALRLLREELVRNRQLADELADALQRAEASSAAKSEFLANMSHELRTPLNAIIGFSQLLRLVAKPKLNPAEIGYLGDIEGAGQHLLAVVTEILDLARVDAGKLILEEEDIDVGDLVSASARMLARASDEAEVKLLASAPREEIVVRGDRTRLQQCLLNLLSNAIKFTPRGGEVEVIACIESNGDLAIWVRDSGVGMTEEQIQIALQPFGQVEGAYSRTNHGIGLGLPLVKKLLEAHGGVLAMHSRPHHGTWAGMLIPAKRVLGFAVRLQGRVDPPFAEEPTQARVPARARV